MKEHHFNKIAALHLLILPYQQIYPYSLRPPPLYYLLLPSLLLHLLAFAFHFLSFRPAFS